MIKTTGLTKKYTLNNYTELVAVRDLNIEIPEGEIIGILGVNGAGKTTTIKMLSTLLKPTAGEILVDGEKMESNLENIKKKINVISGGERGLYWRLTGQENLEYFSALYGRFNNDEVINRTLKIVDLYDFKNTPVEKYSKGMKQRLKIAKGLLNDPKYLFLDEPTLGLDIMIAHEFRSYIKNLAETYHKGIVLTTHYMAEAEELCDYLYIIDKGRMIACGKPGEVIDKYCRNKEYVVETDADKNFLENLASKLNAKFKCEDGKMCFVADRDLFVPIYKEIDDAGFLIAGIQKKENSLENAVYEIIKQAEETK